MYLGIAAGGGAKTGSLSLTLIVRLVLHLGSNFDCLHCLAAASEAPNLANFKTPQNLRF